MLHMQCLQLSQHCPEQVSCTFGPCRLLLLQLGEELLRMAADLHSSFGANMVLDTPPGPAARWQYCRPIWQG